MCVRVASANYGLPLAEVQEVIGLRPVTRVFHAPPVLAGIINLRGEVLPVLDLALLLRVDNAAAKPGDARIVVVRENSGLARRAGLLVDELLGMLDVPVDGWVPVRSSLPPAIRHCVLGVVPASPPCAVLDIASIMSAPELTLLMGTDQV
jgi:purine-binding chemotaxis protein CheW